MNVFPPHDTEVLGVVAAPFKKDHARIYKNAADDYYFCCDTCHNCGQPWHGEDYAITQALDHLMFFDHSEYKSEGSDG